MSVIVNPMTCQPVDDESLKAISDLAEEQVQLEKALEAMEAQMATISDKLRNVREELLPSAMEAIGMSSFKLTDGTSITVDPFYNAKIPDDRQPEAFTWLRDHNFDSLIKREFKLQFGKGEDKKAETLKLKLLKAGFNPTDKTSVHPQTLKAFVREQIEDGKPLPTDLFGVYVGKRAKISPPKS